MKTFVERLGLARNKRFSGGFNDFQRQIYDDAFDAAIQLDGYINNLNNPDFSRARLGSDLRFKSQSGGLSRTVNIGNVKKLLADFHAFNSSDLETIDSRRSLGLAKNYGRSVTKDSNIVPLYDAFETAAEEQDANNNNLNDRYEAEAYGYSQKKGDNQGDRPTDIANARLREIQRGQHSDWGSDNLTGDMLNAQVKLGKDGKALLSPDPSWDGAKIPIMQEGHDAGFFQPTTEPMSTYSYFPSYEGSFWKALTNSSPTVGEELLRQNKGTYKPVVGTGSDQRFADSNDTDVVYGAGQNPNERVYGPGSALTQAAIVGGVGSEITGFTGEMVGKGLKSEGLVNASNKIRPTSMFKKGGLINRQFSAPSGNVVDMNELLAANKNLTVDPKAMNQALSSPEVTDVKGYAPGDNPGLRDRLFSRKSNPQITEIPNPTPAPAPAPVEPPKPITYVDKEAAQVKASDAFDEYKKKLANSKLKPRKNEYLQKQLSSLEKVGANKFFTDYYEKLPQGQRNALKKEFLRVEQARAKSGVLPKGGSSLTKLLKLAGVAGVALGVGDAMGSTVSSGTSLLEGDFSGAGQDMMNAGQKLGATVNPLELDTLRDPDSPLSVYPETPDSQTLKRQQMLMEPMMRQEAQTDIRQNNPVYQDQLAKDQAFTKEMAQLRALRGQGFDQPIIDRMEELNKSRYQIDVRDELSGLSSDEQAINPYWEKGVVNIYDPAEVAKLRRLEQLAKEEQAATQRAIMDEQRNKPLDLNVFGWEIEDFQN